MKRELYGTDRPGLTSQTKIARAAAERVGLDLEALRAAFPIGFGLLLDELRRWTPR